MRIMAKYNQLYKFYYVLQKQIVETTNPKTDEEVMILSK